MRARLARRGTLLLAALALVTMSALALASSAEAAGMLQAGAHGRAYVFNPASTVSVAPGAAHGASDTGQMAGGLAALALLLGGIGVVGRTAGRSVCAPAGGSAGGAQ
jgi:hypothetical protein